MSEDKKAGVRMPWEDRDINTTQLAQRGWDCSFSRKTRNKSLPEDQFLKDGEATGTHLEHGQSYSHREV